MDDGRMDKLVNLGAETLAEALLEMAARSELAEDLVLRLTSTEEENIRRFRRKMSRLRNTDNFIDWRHADEFARELEGMIQDLKVGVQDPLAGVRLLANFYRMDQDLFARCDDSDGVIGHIFEHAASEAFVEFASRCPDPEAVAEIVLELNRQDDYGVRAALLCRVDEFLPEPVMRGMIDQLERWPKPESAADGGADRRHQIEVLARAVKDAALFERTRLAGRFEPQVIDFIDIARVHRESGNLAEARSLLERIPEAGLVHRYARDSLLLEIFRQQGDAEGAKKILTRRFQENPSSGSLEALLEVVGADKRVAIVAGQASLIMEGKALEAARAEFLIAVGRADLAEKYVLDRTEHLDGDFYHGLLPLAAGLAQAGKYLAASLIYRSLLTSILERGFSKAYHHGVDYLVAMDGMAADITDWQRFLDHEGFKSAVFERYRRKWSFWAKYKERS